MSAAPLTTLPAPSRTYPSLCAAAIPLFALCLAFFVEMVDNTLMSVALPTIGRDLGGGTLSLQWVAAAYSVTFGGLLLTAGSAADRLGRRRVLLVGRALFGGVSLGVLAVHSMGALIGLRAALGVAAAMMAPVTNSLVFRLFDDDGLRRKAFTVMITVGMTGFILGPVLGGGALTHVAWQWLLLVNAPIALIAWIGVRRGVPADHPEDLTDDRLDLPAALLSVVAIGIGCFTFTSGVLFGWRSWQTVASALVAVIAVALFVVHERRAHEPMLDLGLLGLGTVRGALVVQLATAVAMAAVMFGLILHFQYAYGWSPMKAGLANLPMIVTMLAASPLAESLVTRFGHRLACVIGSALLAGSLAHGAGRRPRLPRDRALHGHVHHRAAHRDDHVRRRTGRRDAEQPHVSGHLAKRHRPGDRLQHRHGVHWHNDRGPRHDGAPQRRLEQRASVVVLPGRTDRLPHPGCSGGSGRRLGGADAHRLPRD